MSRTVVLGYPQLEAAQQAAANYADEYKVMIIGPTDQLLAEHVSQGRMLWDGDADGGLYVMIATKDALIGPHSPE